MAVRWLSLYPEEHYRLAKKTAATKTRSEQGRRADLDNQFFRSGWEANYARYLNWLIEQGQVASWLFENRTFWFDGIRRGCVSYKPDFEVTLPSGAVEYHEIKGYMDDKSRVKLQRMKKYHPKVVVKLIDKDVYKGIAQSVSRIIPNWE